MRTVTLPTTLLVAVLTSSVSANSPVACAGTCVLNTDCDQTAKCASCIEVDPKASKFQCGAGCLAACDSDAQCLTSWCNKCTNGTCQHGAGPAPPPGPAPGPAKQCGGNCKLNTDCDQSTDCKSCIVQADNTTMKCGAGCLATCKSDSECGAAWCSKCINNTCQHGNAPAPGPSPGPALQCGAGCKANLDCDQKTHCNLCVAQGNSSKPTSFKCGAGCMGNCTSDSECAAEWCNKCVKGQCVHMAPGPAPAPPGAKCNIACSSAADCASDSECSTCNSVTNTCRAPPAACGGHCAYDVDCSTDCGKCSGNTCTKAA